MRKLVARTTPLEMRVMNAFQTPMAQLATPVIHRRVAPIPVATGSCTQTPGAQRRGQDRSHAP